MTTKKRILIIKLSALGDFIQNLGIMRAIRDHHKDAEITLLTTKPYKDLGLKSRYIDNVIIDPRPKFYQISKWLGLNKQLNEYSFDTAYDLQINDRTALYYKLLKTKPTWVGALKKQERGKSDFAFYRHRKMIEKYSIHGAEIDKMEWMKGDIKRFDIKDNYALIVPGCAPTRPEKRWPAKHYAQLCNHLSDKNIQPVLIGTKDEAGILNSIASHCPHALNLMGKTSLFDIAPLARNARFAVGNDTGPMHIIGPTGCPSIVLFSGSSNPNKHAPIGAQIKTIQKGNIADIALSDVLKEIEKF